MNHIVLVFCYIMGSLCIVALIFLFIYLLSYCVSMNTNKIKLETESISPICTPGDKYEIK